MIDLEKAKIGVIGLGYVGLPLACEFGRKYETLGYDINASRVSALNEGRDSTLEISPEELLASKRLKFSSEVSSLKKCNIYIVTVPTPIDKYKNPDLGPLKSASRLIGSMINKNDIVVYESTVFPGCTEEECIPVIEAESGLVFGKDFFAGYSPERINPGDKEHRVADILKVTSGSDQRTGDLVDQLYASVITAVTYKAESIRVAEAAKVIENTQRDLNIALVNELAIIFEKLNIDTRQVLDAAGTKWNFLPFTPGLVGGHCISVDPYYLTHKAQEIGYHPEVIMAGRKINDGMGDYVGDCVVKLMLKKRIHVVDARVLVMGLAFKENCPDVRNTRVIDVIKSLQAYHADVDVWDPWVDADDAMRQYGIELIQSPNNGVYDAIILCVAHKQFIEISGADIGALGKSNNVLYDVKGVLDKALVDGRL